MSDLQWTRQWEQDNGTLKRALAESMCAYPWIDRRLL